MKTCVLFLLVLGSVYSAPVEQGGLQPGSCEDASAVNAAHLALSKINLDRSEGYVFSLHRLSNVNLGKHGETGVVFYLTLDVVETNCSVLSRKDWKQCEARHDAEMPVYGQCKATIYINKPHRVVRLYKYNCVVRPVPAARLNAICPDCPTFIGFDSKIVQNTVSQSLEKFNNESGLNNNFALLKILRATAGMAMSMYYHVEYTIQETTCGKYKQAPAGEKCPIMTCEFSHKGFCKASLYTMDIKPDIRVECEIYEQEAAEREKKQHLLGDATDHPHNDTHSHGHGKGHGHEHGKGHSHGHGHGHRPGHGQGQGHDHLHAYHAQAQNHSLPFPNQHHNYNHPEGTHTHDHDHELALDHDHKHAHLHEHEHHHHHHTHEHESEPHNVPEGMVRMLAAMDQPMTLPSFPDIPAGGSEVGVTLPLKPDPQIPGVTEPTILAYPTSVSAECPVPAGGRSLVDALFREDPLFKPAA
ncbi:hypothetical protein AMECASPLE_021046 [Ameca splendens]|uniref:Cystatin fetuin-B-type domain-containing protein n=1 Tax=Ameca splendens TaxID=208324 RepID=A0ABV0ZQZ6_9TELE